MAAAPGWYSHEDGTVKYWNGSQWLETPPTPPSQKSPKTWTYILAGVAWTLFVFLALSIVGGVVRDHQDSRNGNSSSSSVTNDAGLNESQFNDLLSKAWRESSSSVRVNICDGWNSGMEAPLMKAFLEGSGYEDEHSRKWATKFFSDNC